MTEREFLEDELLMLYDKMVIDNNLLGAAEMLMRWSTSINAARTRQAKANNS